MRDEIEHNRVYTEVGVSRENSPLPQPDPNEVHIVLLPPPPTVMGDIEMLRKLHRLRTLYYYQENTYLGLVAVLVRVGGLMYSL